jgi:hypothetical protein
MGKGTQFENGIAANPLRDDELQKRPELRLRHDFEFVDVDAGVSLAEALERLAHKDAERLGVRSARLGIEAVLVPAKRYADLVGAELDTSHDFVGTQDGRIVPNQLANSDVEQVDPSADWRVSSS